jgi:transcriptional regulator with XRE-family HTH domain
MNYSKALMVIRATKGLQQKDIADILDVTPSYVSRIEKGERPMSSNMIKKLCAELEIPEDLFMLLARDSKNLNFEDNELMDEMAKKLLKIILQS